MTTHEYTCAAGRLTIRERTRTDREPDFSVTVNLYDALEGLPDEARLDAAAAVGWGPVWTKMIERLTSWSGDSGSNDDRDRLALLCATEARALSGYRWNMLGELAQAALRIVEEEIRREREHLTLQRILAALRTVKTIDGMDRQTWVAQVVPLAQDAPAAAYSHPLYLEFRAMVEAKLDEAAAGMVRVDWRWPRDDSFEANLVAAMAARGLTLDVRQDAAEEPTP